MIYDFTYNARGLRGSDYLIKLLQREDGWFFDEDMFASSDSSHCRTEVSIIGRGYTNEIYVMS